MTVREVLKMGDPRLLETSATIDQFNTPYLQQVLLDLKDTMKAMNGAGIAAPQVGEMVQMVIYGGTGKNPRYPDAPAIPFTVLINPACVALFRAISPFAFKALTSTATRSINPLAAFTLAWYNTSVITFSARCTRCA
jgi:hypothetical protein